MNNYIRIDIDASLTEDGIEEQATEALPANIAAVAEYISRRFGRTDGIDCTVDINDSDWFIVTPVTMKNSTKLRIPAKYQPMLKEVYSEPGNGYWAHTTRGFYSAFMECGTIHEDTQKEFLSMLPELTACGEGRYPGECLCGHDCLT